MEKLTRAERRHQRAQRMEYADIIRQFEMEKRYSQQGAQSVSVEHANAILKGAA